MHGVSGRQNAPSPPSSRPATMSSSRRVMEMSPSVRVRVPSTSAVPTSEARGDVRQARRDAQRGAGADARVEAAHGLEHVAARSDRATTALPTRARPPARASSASARVLVERDRALARPDSPSTKAGASVESRARARGSGAWRSSASIDTTTRRGAMCAKLACARAAARSGRRLNGSHRGARALVAAQFLDPVARLVGARAVRFEVEIARRRFAQRAAVGPPAAPPARGASIRGSPDSASCARSCTRS